MPIEPNSLTPASEDSGVAPLVDHLRENHRLAVVGSLTGKIVHGMNNTLTMVKANLDDIREGLVVGEAGEAASEALLEVSEAAATLENTVRAMNAYLRGASEQEEVDLVDSLRTTYILLEPKIRYSTNLRLHEESESELQIMGSVTNIMQVFTTVLLHIDARPSQYGDVEVSFKKTLHGDISILFEDVRPPGIVAHIPDGDVSDTSLDPEVGMLLARHIMDEHGGTLKIAIPREDVTSYELRFPPR